MYTRSPCIWAALLLLTAPSLWKCSASVSHVGHSCSHHTLSKLLVLSFHNVNNCQGSKWGGTGWPCKPDHNCFHMFSVSAWDQFIANGNILSAYLFTRFTHFFSASLIFQNFTIQLKWWNHTIAVWHRESVNKLPYPSPKHGSYFPQPSVYEYASTKQNRFSKSVIHYSPGVVRKPALIFDKCHFQHRLFAYTNKLLNDTECMLKFECEWSQTQIPWRSP